MRFTTKSNENKRMNFNKDKYKPQKPRAPLVGFSKVPRDEGLDAGGAMRVCVLGHIIIRRWCVMMIVIRVQRMKQKVKLYPKKGPQGAQMLRSHRFLKRFSLNFISFYSLKVYARHSNPEGLNVTINLTEACMRWTACLI